MITTAMMITIIWPKGSRVEGSRVKGQKAFWKCVHGGMVQGLRVKGPKGQRVKGQ